MSCPSWDVNSPALMNPKKPRQKAAHSITRSKVSVSCDQRVWILRRMAGVIVWRLGCVWSGVSL